MKDTLTPEELEALPAQLIAINRKLFRLALWKRTGRSWYKARSLSCAVGTPLHPTPRGTFTVLSKARHPDWLMPNSSWVAKELRGTTVPGNTADNPIKEAFLKLSDDGIGIHGTDSLSSLRSRASHGCIRVRPDDAIYLYRHVAVGAPCYIT